eukprot:CFRG5610T1
MYPDVETEPKRLFTEECINALYTVCPEFDRNLTTMNTYDYSNTVECYYVNYDNVTSAGCPQLDVQQILMPERTFPPIISLSCYDMINSTCASSCKGNVNEVTCLRECIQIAMPVFNRATDIDCQSWSCLVDISKYCGACNSLETTGERIACADECMANNEHILADGGCKPVSDLFPSERISTNYVLGLYNCPKTDHGCDRIINGTCEALGNGNCPVDDSQCVARWILSEENADSLSTCGFVDVAEKVWETCGHCATFAMDSAAHCNLNGTDIQNTCKYSDNEDMQASIGCIRTCMENV